MTARIGGAMARKPRSALVAIDIDGLRHDPVLRARCARRARQALGRLSVAPAAARINFTDENGPRGGVGVRCAITVPVPRRASIHVEHLAEMHGTAFDAALDTLEHRLTEERRRERESARRPKKYYAAKRALTEGLPAPTW
jgi:ribosome-associated translation inhibitor RaiA